MMQKAAMLCALLAAALAAGCANVPGTGATEPGNMSRPLSDQSPVGDAEARARTHVDLGMAYFELGRFDVALDEARIAMDNVAGYAPAHHLTGLVYMMLGEAAAARGNFEQALRAAPGDPDFNNSYGWFLCTQGQERDGLARLSSSARNPYYRYASRPSLTPACATCA
ncbi:tetratricopeptide repeat protein [Thauera sinica]|uniref:tetratricopeptide repeat protein n=1 Tax=Thauera sp. K11 TaxID=2005884 RepID=UPI001E47C3CF|nr:tetratricopeptide repeat protein [Thauera sp. K11]